MARKETRLPDRGVRVALPRSWRLKFQSRLLVSLLLGLVTLALFLPTVGFDFVDYDDSDYVKANPHVLTGLNAENLAWALRSGHASNWHPLTWWSHMLDCQWFGPGPRGPHLVNVLLHTGNAALLFLVLAQLTGSFWRSAFVAALFAWHPLHVESVAWISERKDVLSTLFFVLTVWAYTKYVERSEGRTPNVGLTLKPEAAKLKPPPQAPSPNPIPSTGQSSGGWKRDAVGYYLLALALFALGLMSKPMLVTLPFVLLLLDYWPLQRAPSQNAGRPGAPFHRLLLEKLPFFALSAISSVITFLVQRKGGAVSTSLSLEARVANAVVSYLRYVGKLLWPEHLSVLYPHPGTWPATTVIFCAAMLLGISVGVVMLGRRKPYLLVGWLWFLGTLIPVIGLVQVGVQSMADRYTYLPIIGLFVMVAWGMSDLVAAYSRRGTVLWAGAALALGLCAILTSRQIRYWRDSEALFSHAVQVTKDNYLAYNNLGFFLSRKGDLAGALENYRKSLQINPAYEDALNNYGYALAGQKKYAEALGYYQAALRVRTNQVEVHNNLGNALSELGRIDEAIQHYQIVLQQNPEHADAHNNLGIALAMKGQLDLAIPHFRDAIRFKPGYASAHSNLGNALAVQHKLEEAIQEYRESLRLKPDEPQAHNNLGNALAELGRLDEAVAQYTEALRLNADNPEAEYNLAMALSRLGKRDQAAQHLNEALRRRPDYPEAKRALENLQRP